MSAPVSAFVPEAAPPFRQRLEQATVLVVDDLYPMRRLLSDQLRELGAKHILEAPNGVEALAILLKEPVTLVIADWNMPVLSGLDLLLAVRADPQLAFLPFIMITAEARRERIQQVIDAGVTALLVKPYTSAYLAERLERALMRDVPWASLSGAPASGASQEDGEVAPGLTVAPARTSARPPRASPGKPTVLAVDDTPDNLSLLGELFKGEYRVRIAHNGEKALAICHSETPPDLVLLDVMMPGIDGFEVAAKLRAHPASEHIPIIFVTALSDEESRQKGMELGAVDFVTKPVEPNLLRLRVRNFMRYINLHRQLQSDYDTMLEASRLREDVDQIVRHDLKGPLASVVGLTQDLIENSTLRSEQCDQLRLIESAALHTLDTINLSAELYKIEAGRFELQPRAVPLARIIRRLVFTACKIYAAKGLEITLRSVDGLEAEAEARGDPGFCHSLLQNLLKNACEAAPVGSRIVLTLSAVEAITVSIENSGVVPIAIRSRFFDKYSTAGKEGGTGLGTYSAKLLTEAQGGSIVMETSDEQNLTRLTVCLPKMETGGK
ncbi:hybrid sensor histidine kinase/response regulator [Niveibacterium sp. SC-1]|uniref:ATP-binding response regulator n=1 Tax=Niveibacterium sp. SC-1 TaxID=3135646 RepID=UPI00311E1E33